MNKRAGNPYRPGQTQDVTIQVCVTRKLKDQFAELCQTTAKVTPSEYLRKMLEQMVQDWEHKEAQKNLKTRRLEAS